MNQARTDSTWLQPHLSSSFGVTKSCLETQTDLYLTVLQPKDQIPQTLLYLMIRRKKKELGHAQKETCRDLTRADSSTTKTARNRPHGQKTTGIKTENTQTMPSHTPTGTDRMTDYKANRILPKPLQLQPYFTTCRAVS